MKPLVWLALLSVGTWLSGPGPSAQATAPFATMAARTVTLHPSNATFTIPDEVVGLEGRDLAKYLTRTELELIKTVDPPNWDAPYNRILNAAVPFSACVVHIGTEPWGLGSRNFGDLQIRVYVIDGPAAPVQDTIARDGVAEAAKVFPAAPRFPSPALSTPETGNAWSLSRMSYMRNGGDFGAGVNLDFYVREFGAQTVVIFMHYPPATRVRTWDSVVAKIVDSFAWPK